MHRHFAFALFLTSVSLVSAQGRRVNLCDLAGVPSAHFAGPIETPLAILGNVVVKSGWTLDQFTLIETRDVRVKENAASQVCIAPSCNCIFYDPDFLRTAPPSNDGTSWVAYFVLAHEAGHIIKPAANKPDPDREAAADDWAGWALEKINAPVDGLLAGVDYVARSEEASEGYHDPCRRRMDALAGYNRAAAEDGKPQHPECLSCFASSLLGLYLTSDLHSGAAITPGSVTKCGSLNSADLPIDFDRDVRGACLLSNSRRGDQLTWFNLGLCSQ